jgi:hypothetical protein
VTHCVAGRRPLGLSPFRGVRYSPDFVVDLASVTSPPYDTLDDDAIDAPMAAEPFPHRPNHPSTLQQTSHG